MTRLEELARAKGWLDSLRPLPPDVTEELRHRYEVRLTYHSTAIEGNTLTQSETQIVLEKGVTIGGKSLREHLEVIGHRDALEFVIALANSTEEIGERQIRQIHSLVMKDQSQGDAGAFRQLDVKAAGTEFVYPSWMHVSNLMAELVEWLQSTSNLNPIELATEAHLRFVTIHPFRDGNGRVGRLLMSLTLIRAGYPIAVIPVERRSEYIDSLVEAQSQGSSQRLFNLVMDCVEFELRETLRTCLSSGVIQIAPSVRDEISAWVG